MQKTAPNERFGASGGRPNRQSFTRRKERQADDSAKLDKLEY